MRIYFVKIGEGTNHSIIGLYSSIERAYNAAIPYIENPDLTLQQAKAVDSSQYNVIIHDKKHLNVSAIFETFDVDSRNTTFYRIVNSDGFAFYSNFKSAFNNLSRLILDNFGSTDNIFIESNGNVLPFNYQNAFRSRDIAFHIININPINKNEEDLFTVELWYLNEDARLY
ncbi:MAG: hypothetical protein WC783_02830 [Candidatus Paceibacterota bacterium]|jgi:hypothetical protein